MSESSHQQGHVTVGDWIIFMILMTIPVANFVVLFYEAFGSNRNPSKQNYCRAILILSVLTIVSTILMIVMFGATLSSLFGDVDWNNINNMNLPSEIHLAPEDLLNPQTQPTTPQP